jgi:hypothetical protein
MGTSVSGAAPLGDGPFIAAIFWRPLSGGMMIRVEAGRMTSRFGDSRVPKYGRLTAFPTKD